MKQKTTLDWSSLNLKQMYTSKLPITKAKKTDLLELLKLKVIPEDYVNFIEEIPTANRTMNVASDYDEEEDAM
ncbi:hypothetical protein JTB14_028974 [Gonioctena quinquepunctata]|nr:hypothetical protein JTB14_028974 [Gonioctena quinquepunctata]